MFLNRTGIVLYVFYWDLMVSWLHLMFQVFKCLKWRVQPQTSVLTSKKPSLAMLYIFFWAFSVHLLLFIMFFFVYRLQLKSTNTCIWYFSFILCFFSRYLFFVCFLKPTSMFLYFLFSVVFDFWLHLKFQFFLILQMKITTTNIFFKSQ